MLPEIRHSKDGLDTLGNQSVTESELGDALYCLECLDKRLSIVDVAGNHINTLCGEPFGLLARCVPCNTPDFPPIGVEEGMHDCTTLLAGRTYNSNCSSHGEAIRVSTLLQLWNIKKVLFR